MFRISRFRTTDINVDQRDSVKIAFPYHLTMFAGTLLKHFDIYVI